MGGSLRLGKPLSYSLAGAPSTGWMDGGLLGEVGVCQIGGARFRNSD